MKINIRVVPSASRLEVKTINGVLKVYLTKPAVDGQANTQLIEIIADYFQVKKYQVEIIQGLNNRNKIINIEDEAIPFGRRK